MGSSRSIASALVTPRYVSRNSTTRHHRPVVGSDTTSTDVLMGTRSRCLVIPAANRADDIVGTRKVGKHAWIVSRVVDPV